MGLDGVSRQYRLITGQDSPTDAKKVKGANKPKPGPEVAAPAEAEAETPVEPEPEPES